MNEKMTDYAGPWRRLLAFVIDITLLGVVSLPLWLWFLLSVRNTPPVPLPTLALGLFIIWYFFSIFYFIICWASFGRTLGQQLLKVKLVRREGQGPGVGISMLRYLIGYSIYYILFCLFIFPALGLLVAMALDKQKRGIPDLMFGTYVIKTG